MATAPAPAPPQFGGGKKLNPPTEEEIANKAGIKGYNPFTIFKRASPRLIDKEVAFGEANPIIGGKTKFYGKDGRPKALPGAPALAYSPLAPQYSPMARKALGLQRPAVPRLRGSRAQPAQMFRGPLA